MNGARFVHDTLEELGWDVLIADAQKVKGLAPLACKTDKIDVRVLALWSERELVPAIWLPDPGVRREREQARFRLQLVKHRSMVKHRIHSTRDRGEFSLPTEATLQLASLRNIAESAATA
jgi:transposase